MNMTPVGSIMLAEIACKEHLYKYEDTTVYITDNGTLILVDSSTGALQGAFKEWLSIRAIANPKQDP